MSLEVLRQIAIQVIDQLAQGEYKALVQQCAQSRLTSKDLEIVIGDYGKKLVSPPRDAYKKLDAIQVKDAIVPTWSVRVPLWTAEEGRSDLTLELTICLTPDKPIIKLDDLHVL
jgi:hypothetical protein